MSSCNTSNDDELDYSLYYSYGDGIKGVEIYCWKSDDEWYSVLIYGTNRQKTEDEIQWLQYNLPCPLEKMREILASFSDYTRNTISLTIVSYPALRSELNFVKSDSIKEVLTYLYIYTVLDIDPSDVYIPFKSKISTSGVFNPYFYINQI